MHKKINKHPSLVFKVKEFRAFMRLETCLYISCIGVSGFLLFNPISHVMLPLFLATMFLTGASYAYNHLTDMEEDGINNKRLNAFVTNGRGVPAVAGMIAAGLVFSVFLSPASFAIFLACIPLIIAYSRLRVKEIFLAKNIYTGLTIGIIFLMGAAAGGAVTGQMLFSFLVAAFFGFMLNVLGDIRGYEGDIAAGVKTIPVFIGVGPSIRLSQSLFIGFSVCILVFRIYSFYPLAPFALMISLSLAFEKHKLARLCILSSFIVFSAFLLMLKTLEAGV
jgi:4-hydroxybenzoate polyprenyltransferase